MAKTKAGRPKTQSDGLSNGTTDATAAPQRRAATPPRVLVERPLLAVEEGRPGRAQRMVTVNLRESPLSWLRARALIDARQFEAGERLREDYERALLAPSVTMKWETSPVGRRSGAGAEPLNPTQAQIAAKQRFDGAMATVGQGLNDVLWRVVCAGEGLPAAERALGWPSRSGRLVLTLALNRLADGYGLK